jgi:hypothetical protein
MLRVLQLPLGVAIALFERPLQIGKRERPESLARL